MLNLEIYSETLAPADFEAKNAFISQTLYPFTPSSLCNGGLEILQSV